MRQILVQYKTKPGLADKNARLSQAVFSELADATPAGVRYLVLRLDDDTFVHFATMEDGARPITDLTAFQAFQEDIDERCLEPAVVRDATIVGQYP
jgi:hypothetical protein